MGPVHIEPRRPNWTDRQLIAAADLTAEQQWQDAQLARLRRFALGWGVVAGFGVVWQTGSLMIQPGYGITPLGREVYLPEAVSWEGIVAELIAACAPEWAQNCDNTTAVRPPSELVPPPREGSETVPLSRTAWIVARPEVVQSCPRPGVARGCAHPGNTWAMSRQGAALNFAIVCTLDPGLLPVAPDCIALGALLTGGEVAMPPELEDVLPIAQVSFDAGGLNDVTTALRRRMLPMALVQDMVQCCDCVTPEPEPEPEPEPLPLPVEEDRATPASVWDFPEAQGLAALMDDFGGFFPNGNADLRQTLDRVFKTAAARRLAAGADQINADPYRSFVAATMVSTRQDHAKWQAGNYLALYAAALGSGRGIVGGVRLAPPSGLPAGLARTTLGDLVTRAPNVTGLRTRVDDLKVREVLAMSDARLADNVRTLDPGPAAVLRWIAARLQLIAAVH